MTKLLPALVCAILVLSPGVSPAVDKDDDVLLPEKAVAGKLVKIGDKVEIPAGDGGKIDITVTIGKNEYPATVHVGEKGKIQWAIEEFPGADGKKKPCLTLRFHRPDGDNPSIQFDKKVAPKLKQLCVYLNTEVDTRGTIYVGKQGDSGETVNLPVDNQFSSLGNAGDKTVGPVAYITPKYETADGKKADGVTGLFVARTGTKTKTTFKDAAVIFTLTGFEQLPAKK